jgi:hypothetical protein
MASCSAGIGPDPQAAQTQTNSALDQSPAPTTQTALPPSTSQDDTTTQSLVSTVPVEVQNTPTELQQATPQYVPYVFQKKRDSIIPGSTTSITVFDYAGIKDGKQGMGLVEVNPKDAINENTLYEFQYLLPDRGEGYAGFAIEFNEPQDISHFSTLNFTITFLGANTVLRVYVRDKADNQPWIVLGDGVYASAQDGVQTVSIPLSEFKKPLDLSSVFQIKFGASSSYTSGKHQTVIQNVHFK